MRAGHWEREDTKESAGARSIATGSHMASRLQEDLAEISDIGHANLEHGDVASRVVIDFTNVG